MEDLKFIKVHYNQSVPVNNWNAIKDTAEAMDKLMAQREHMLAIHHAYVTDRPLNFFVLNDVTLKDFIEKMQSKYIINPKITGFIKASVMAMPEGCAAFPHKSPKKVMRAFVLKVTYYIPDPLSKTGLKKVEKEVDRIMAQIFQHEIDHAEGRNIFYTGPKK